MKYLLILIFCFGHFTSYGNDKKVIEELENVKKIIEEKTDQYAKLQNQIKRTKDEASCKALKIQIEKLSKQIKAIALESRMKVGLTQLGSCSKTGYVPPL